MSRPTRIVAVSALTVLIVVVAVVAIAPRVGNAMAGAHGVHDAAVLPNQIRLCDRSWHKDALDRRFTLTQTRVLFGGGAVVDPAAPDSCPAGPCTDVAQAGTCDVIVWIRVGDDAYLDYSLQGGP